MAKKKQNTRHDEVEALYKQMSENQKQIKVKMKEFKKEIQVTKRDKIHRSIQSLIDKNIKLGNKALGLVLKNE